MGSAFSFLVVPGGVGGQDVSLLTGIGIRWEIVDEFRHIVGGVGGQTAAADGGDGHDGNCAQLYGYFQLTSGMVSLVKQGGEWRVWLKQGEEQATFCISAGKIFRPAKSRFHFPISRLRLWRQYCQ